MEKYFTHSSMEKNTGHWQEGSRGLGLMDMFCLVVITLLFSFISAHEIELKERKIAMYNPNIRK